MQDIFRVRDGILKLCSPEKIYLFNLKKDMSGKATTSFKLCVIIEADDLPAIEKELYLGIESGMPFDLVLYTPREWAEYSAEEQSFARRILTEGTMIYERG